MYCLCTIPAFLVFRRPRNRICAGLGDKPGGYSCICFHGLTITVLRPACYILWPTPRAMRQPPLWRGVVLVPLHDYIMLRIGSGVLSLPTRAPGFNGWSVASITNQHLHQGDTIGGASTLCTIAALDVCGWCETRTHGHLLVRQGSLTTRRPTQFTPIFPSCRHWHLHGCIFICAVLTHYRPFRRPCALLFGY